MRHDTVMLRFHDVANARRLETSTKQHSLALYSTPAQLGFIKRSQSKQYRKIKTRGAFRFSLQLTVKLMFRLRET